MNEIKKDVIAVVFGNGCQSSFREIRVEKTKTRQKKKHRELERWD